MKRLCISYLIPFLLFASATADDKEQPADEPPRLAVALKLSVETYDPNQPAGTLNCVVRNRSTEEILLPAEYDGRQLVVYGRGKTHRGFSNLGKPDRKAQEQPRLLRIGPGKESTVFEVSLKDILTPQTDRAIARKRAWDWRYRFEPPKTPIHGWRRLGFEESAEFFAELRVSKEQLKSEPVVLTVTVTKKLD